MLISHLHASVENVLKLHGVVCLVVGSLVYTQYFHDVIVMFGVGGESAHSLRNTGFLLMLLSFLSLSAVWSFARKLPTFFGSLLCVGGAVQDSQHAFAVGLAVSSNLFLLCHYTVEAFVHNAVSSIFVSGMWVSTLFVLIGIKVGFNEKISERKAE